MPSFVQAAPALGEGAAIDEDIPTSSTKDAAIARILIKVV
jgi:hypothetical protein